MRLGPPAFIDGTASSRYEDCSATLRDCEIGKVCVVAGDWVAAQRGCRFFFVFRFFFGFETYLSPNIFPTQLLWKPSVFVEITDHEISPLGQIYSGCYCCTRWPNMALSLCVSADEIGKMVSSWSSLSMFQCASVPVCIPNTPYFVISNFGI